MFNSLVSLFFGGERKRSAPEPVDFDDDDAVNIDSTSGIGNNEEEKENIPGMIQFETNEEDDWLLVSVSSDDSQSEDDMCLSRLTESQSNAMSIIQESAIPRNVASELSPEIQTIVLVNESLSGREDMSFSKSTASLSAMSIIQESAIPRNVASELSPEIQTIVQVNESLSGREDMSFSKSTASLSAMSIIQESAIPRNVASQLSPEIQTIVLVNESLSGREDMSFSKLTASLSSLTESLITSMDSLSESTESQTSCESITQEALMLESLTQEISPKVKTVVKVLKTESENEMCHNKYGKCQETNLKRTAKWRPTHKNDSLEPLPVVKITNAGDISQSKTEILELCLSNSPLPKCSTRSKVEEKMIHKNNAQQFAPQVQNIQVNRSQPRKKVKPNISSMNHPNIATAFVRNVRSKLCTTHEFSPLAEAILGKSQVSEQRWSMLKTFSDIDYYENLQERGNIKARRKRNAETQRLIEEIEDALNSTTLEEPFAYQMALPMCSISQGTTVQNAKDPLKLLSKLMWPDFSFDGEFADDIVENDSSTGIWAKSEKNHVLMDKANLSTCPLHKCSGALSSGVSSRNDKIRDLTRSLYIQTYLVERYNQAGSELSPKCFARYMKEIQQKLCFCQPSVLRTEKAELPETFESHQPTLPSKADLLDHIKSLKPQQKIKDMNIRKLLAPSQMNRQNKVKLYEGKTKKNRRKDLWRCHSGANNNRKCC